MPWWERKVPQIIIAVAIWWIAAMIIIVSSARF